MQDTTLSCTDITVKSASCNSLQKKAEVFCELYNGETPIPCPFLIVEISPIQQEWRDFTFLSGVISDIYVGI